MPRIGANIRIIPDRPKSGKIKIQPMEIEYSHLASVPLLEGLQPTDFEELKPLIETRQFGQGETLFLVGDKGGALMIVIEGHVELFIYDDDNQRLVLSDVGVGSFFGEVTLFDNGTRSTNAMATQLTTVIILRQEVMMSFLHKHPETAIHIINVLSRRLRDTTQLVRAKEGNAFQMLEDSANVWQHISDRLSGMVGSWEYLVGLVLFILTWIALGILSGERNFPSVYDALGILITTLGALQLPLIMMSQKRQDKFEKIQADLDHQVNVRAQLSILEVTRKLDWLQEATLDQTRRMDALESGLEAVAPTAAKSSTIGLS